MTARFPDDAAVLVRYPVESRQPASDRQAWPWLAGIIEQQRGPDEWLVTIEDRRVAELEDGTPAPEGTSEGDLLFPQCSPAANLEQIAAASASRDLDGSVSSGRRHDGQHVAWSLIRGDRPGKIRCLRTRSSVSVTAGTPRSWVRERGAGQGQP
jgi:hypothetical protein